MARPSNKEQRRKDIAGAFLKVMAKKGYSGATVRAVAKEAGVSSGLIHHHFEDKQDILLVAVDGIVESGRQRFEEMNDSNMDCRLKIKAFIDSRLSLGNGENIDAVKAWVLIGSEAVRQEEVRGIYKKAISQQQKYLASLLKEAYSLSLKESKEKSAMIISAIEGSYLLGVTCDGELPKGYASKTLNDLVESLG